MAKLKAAEMQREAKLIYESIVSSDSPGYTPREWSELLTQAQEFEIKDIIEDGFDKNEVNRRAIETLIRDIEIGSGSWASSLMYPNSKVVNLPLTYYHIVNLLVTLKLDSVEYAGVKVVPISAQAYASNKNNVFRKPFYDINNNEGFVWNIVSSEYNSDINAYLGSYTIIYPEEFILEKVIISYIVNPRPIIVPFLYTSGTIEGLVLSDPLQQAGLDCELSSIVQRKIVQRAANLAAAYTRDRIGYQMQKTEEATQTAPQRK